MTESLPAPLHLKRSDPARNLARFYVLALQPTLFGETMLVRNWGRIGTTGQGMQETFNAIAEARRDFDRLAKAKMRKGYR